MDEIPIEQVRAELEAAGIDVRGPKVVGKLLRQLAEAHAIVKQSKVLLRKCWSDIFQTARVNQGNLNGVELLEPNDNACEEWIGKHFVNQGGVDASLRLREEISDFLAEHASPTENE